MGRERNGWWRLLLDAYAIPDFEMGSVPGRFELLHKVKEYLKSWAMTHLTLPQGAQVTLRASVFAILKTLSAFVEFSVLFLLNNFSVSCFFFLSLLTLRCPLSTSALFLPLPSILSKFPLFYFPSMRYISHREENHNADASWQGPNRRCEPRRYQAKDTSHYDVTKPGKRKCITALADNRRYTVCLVRH